MKEWTPDGSPCAGAWQHVAVGCDMGYLELYANAMCSSLYTVLALWQPKWGLRAPGVGGDSSVSSRGGARAVHKRSVSGGHGNEWEGDMGSECAHDHAVVGMRTQRANVACPGAQEQGEGYRRSQGPEHICTRPWVRLWCAWRHMGWADLG